MKNVKIIYGKEVKAGDEIIVMPSGKRVKAITRESNSRAIVVNYENGGFAVFGENSEIVLVRR